MGLFLVTFGIMALAVTGMAVGVMFGRRPIAGSCGGLNGASACQTCSRPCRERRRAIAAGDLADPPSVITRRRS